MKQDLLGLKDLTADQIKHILDTAATMKELVKSPNKKSASPSGKNRCEFIL